jgi:hypothetical protein
MSTKKLLVNNVNPFFPQRTHQFLRLKKFSQLLSAVSPERDFVLVESQGL